DITIGTKRDRVVIDDGIGALPFHEEAVRGGGVLVRGGNLTRSHRLHAAEQPAAHRRMLPPGIAVVEEGDDASARFFRLYQFDRAQTHCAHIGVAPQRRAIARLGFPRLDCIGPFPKCASISLRKLAIEYLKLRGIGDARSPEDIITGIDDRLGCHDGVSSSEPGDGISSLKYADARGVRSTVRLKMSKR